MNGTPRRAVSTYKNPNTTRPNTLFCALDDGRPPSSTTDQPELDSDGATGLPYPGARVSATATTDDARTA